MGHQTKDHQTKIDLQVKIVGAPSDVLRWERILKDWDEVNR